MRLKGRYLRNQFWIADRGDSTPLGTEASQFGDHFEASKGDIVAKEEINHKITRLLGSTSCGNRPVRRAGRRCGGHPHASGTPTGGAPRGIHFRFETSGPQPVYLKTAVSDRGTLGGLTQFAVSRA